MSRTKRIRGRKPHLKTDNDNGVIQTLEHIQKRQYCPYTGKVSWKKLPDAQHAATMTNRTQVALGQPGNKQAYKCPQCDNWHVGGSTRKELAYDDAQ